MCCRMTSSLITRNLMLRLMIIVFLSHIFLLLNACAWESNPIGCTTEEDCRGVRVCLDGICSDKVNDVVEAEDINEIADVNHIIDTHDLSDAITDISQVDDAHVDDIENDSSEPIQDIVNEDAEVPICPDVCDRGCLNGVCYIEGLDYRPIRCPDGMDCHVLCSPASSCDNSVTCGDGECTVVCEGNGSCGWPIDCGNSSRCTIRCLGNYSCNGAISCGSSECSVECGQPDNRKYTCNGGIDCGTNSCQVACLDDRSCTLAHRPCDDDDCDGAFTCNEADYCRCMGPGCWPTPD